MILSLRHPRSSSLISTLAVMTSLFLVVGQVFHCCRINEAVAALFSHTLEHLEGKVPDEGPEGHPPLVSHHAACHASAPSDEESSHPPIHPEEPCLSEADLILTGVEPGSATPIRLFPTPLVAHALPALPSVPAMPARRDLAGLPPYLLNLRLLG
jgi:hypothetical protein